MMAPFLMTALQLIASALTLAMAWAYPRHALAGAVLGLAATAAWCVLTVAADLPGLWPLNIGMAGVHGWNVVSGLRRPRATVRRVESGADFAQTFRWHTERNLSGTCVVLPAGLSADFSTFLASREFLWWSALRGRRFEDVDPARLAREM